MIRLFFYPIWNPSKLESFLHLMEQQGYRLDYMSLCYFFIFRKSVPQTVRYLFSYSFMKDNEMNLCDCEIRRNFGANPVPTYHSGLRKIHRLCDIDTDISEYTEKRNRYFQQVLTHKIILLVFCLLCAIVAYLNYRKSLLRVLIIGVCMLLAYNTLGMIHLRINRKNKD